MVSGKPLCMVGLLAVADCLAMAQIESRTLPTGYFHCRSNLQLTFIDALSAG